MKRRAWITFLLAAFVSAAIWLLTPMHTNKRVPWDVEGSYYLVALTTAGAVAGAIAPRPLWTPYAGAVAGQLGYELIVVRVGPLILLGALFLLVYCAIFTLAAALAAFVRERVAERFG